MKTMNLDQFKNALEKAARIKGADGVAMQKKLILEGYMVTDAEGMAVDPEMLDVTISAAAPETDAMSDQEKEQSDWSLTSAHAMPSRVLIADAVAGAATSARQAFRFRCSC